MKKFLIIALLLIGIPVLADPLYDTTNEAKLEYNQGVDYYKAGQYDRSMASFRRAIELDPNYVDAYYNLGLILEYLKQDEAALSTFKQIMVRKPDDYDAVYKAAVLSNRLGRSENARQYLSIIPAGSSIYTSAQALAKNLGTDMQTIKADAERAASTETNRAGSTNGMYSNLPSPTGIAGDRGGNIYVACFSDNMIYKLTPDGKKLLFVKDNKINGPIAMVSDSEGNLYVSNYNADNVLKVSPVGAISVFATNVPKPYGMSIINGILYVSSQGANSIMKYRL